jgi:hypothetical protein
VYRETATQLRQGSAQEKVSALSKVRPLLAKPSDVFEVGHLSLCLDLSLHVVVVCVCVCVCICMCLCASVHGMCGCISVCGCVFMFINVHIYICPLIIFFLSAFMSPFFFSSSSCAAVRHTHTHTHTLTYTSIRSHTLPYTLTPSHSHAHTTRACVRTRVSWQLVDEFCYRGGMECLCIGLFNKNAEVRNQTALFLEQLSRVLFRQPSLMLEGNLFLQRAYTDALKDAKTAALVRANSRKALNKRLIL